MLRAKCSLRCLPVFLSVAITAVLFAGCKSDQEKTSDTMASDTVAPAAVKTPPPAVATTPSIAPAAAAANPAMPAPPVRIKAGSSESFKDADGNVWIPEVGFADGDTIERPDLEIANTKTPAIYRSERYSMSSFSYPVPNGKYTVKLHFAETYEGIEGPGQRVFSFNVEGHQFKDFDVWVKAGGPLRAYIETVNVEVTDGKLDITFTPNVENPQINGIEILPGT
jgi:Malectin domain